MNIVLKMLWVHVLKLSQKDGLLRENRQGLGTLEKERRKRGNEKVD